MIRAVLDTNVIISAVLVPVGISGRILAAALRLIFLCSSSDAVLAEVLRTLERERVRRKYAIDPRTVEQLRQFLESDVVRTPNCGRRSRGSLPSRGRPDPGDGGLGPCGLPGDW